MEFNCGFATDIGLRRQQNQDSGMVAPEAGLFVVADGMGGHRGGEIASAVVIETIPGIVEQAQKDPNWEPKKTISDAILASSRAIFSHALKNPELQGMGTTTTALLFKDGVCTIGHVGDSRAYFIRPRAIWQLTRDHSLVQEKLRAGLITREQVKTDQMKNVITRSVGFGQDTMVETYQMETQPGDVFLLCSDGLSGPVEDHEILDIVRKRVFESSDLKSAVADMISLANARGGHDNTTVIITQVKSS